MTRLLVPRQLELANPRGQLIRAYNFGAAAGRDITGRGAVLANLADGWLITPRVGKAGRGAHFTLGGKYSANELLPNISTEITVMLWAEKLGQMAGASDFIFGEHETGAGGYNWGFYESSSSGSLSFYVHNGTSGVSAGTLAWTTTAGPQVWIATYSANAGAVNLYCNGAFIATAAQSGSIRRLSTALIRSCRWQSGTPNFIGYGAAVWNYALHPDEIARVSKRPASVFSGRKRRIWVPVSAGGSSVSLIVADATHAHTADGLVLTSSTALSVADATHAHAADNITLVVGSVLAIAEASHAHAADSPTLTAASELAVADATHGHAADNITLSVAGATNLTVADALHGHAADALALTSAHALIVADATHGHAVDGLTLTAASVLAIQEALHAHAADNITLDASGAVNLLLADSLHAHTADGAALTVAAWLTVADALHGHSADNVVLTFGGVAAEPLARYTIAAKARRLTITAAARRLEIRK